MDQLLVVKNLSKSYGRRGYQTAVLNDINMTVREGDFIAIMGPSGAGKTTLLNLLSTLDQPTHGQILLDGADITAMKNKELSVLRRDKIGFIFQEYNLLDNMTLQDNIALPLSLNGVPGGEVIRRVQEQAKVFGLAEHLNKYPYQLSGGQKQRAASARVLITKPRILFADEPTGALDSRSSRDLLRSLRTVNEEGAATILMVTHDAYTASYAKQVYLLKDGRIECRLNRGADRRAFYEEILSMLATLGGEQE